MDLVIIPTCIIDLFFGGSGRLGATPDVPRQDKFRVRKQNPYGASIFPPLQFAVFSVLRS